MSVALLPNNPFKLLGWFLSAIVDKINEIITALNAGSSDYLVFVASLSQSGTDVPTLTVLKNTLTGAPVPVLSYNATGDYRMQFTGYVFNRVKTGVFVENNVLGFVVAETLADNGDTFYIDTRTTGAVLSNNLLSKTMIEIRVYN